MDLSMWNDQARQLPASSEQGPALVEGALIVVLISPGTFAAMTFLKEPIGGSFSEVGNML